MNKRLGISNWMGNGMRKYFANQGYEFVNLNSFIPWKHVDAEPDYNGFVKEAKTCDIVSIAKGFHYKKHKLTPEMIRDIKKAGTWVFYHQLDIPNTYENALNWEGILKYYREFWTECDVICFPYQEAVDMALEHKLNSKIIHPGYDFETFDVDLNNKEYSNTCDITMVGKCYGDRSKFPRAKMARRLIDEKFDVRLYGWFWLEENQQEEICGHLVGGDPTLKDNYFGELGGRNAGLGMVTEGFNRGKITISSHLLNLTEYTNGRLYETMGLGKCTFSDYNKDMENVGMIDGETIVYYHSLDELVEKARYYLAHDDERNKIGENARKLILDKHTQYKRGEQLLGYYKGK